MQYVFDCMDVYLCYFIVAITAFYGVVGDDGVGSHLADGNVLCAENRKIQKDNIRLLFNSVEVVLNMYHFNLFTSYFGIKENERLCFTYQISTQPQYSYSQQAIDFIYEEIKKSPSTILDDLKEKIAKK